MDSNVPAVDMPIDEEVLTTALTGMALLDTPLLNKGSAFTEDERRELGLLGLLPAHIAPMEEQLDRTYASFKQKTTDLERYIYLTELHDRNETLFYRLVHDHISEMMPVIYTPVVGLACQNYSHIFRRSRGLYLDYPHRDVLPEMLSNIKQADVKVIVVTDGERILGLGDLGVGGMGIPVGKLALYTLCAGIDPTTTLPIILDVGTDNRELLADPLYLGWRHERVRGAEYDAFVEAFVQAVQRTFPDVLLQWEDFSKSNARRLLERYRDRLCTFNDDIQGTGAVTLAGLLVASEIAGVPLPRQRIVILGAGSAATGIAEQVVAGIIGAGGTPQDAQRAIWLVDSRGLVHSGRTDLEPAKRAFAQPDELVGALGMDLSGVVSLADVVHAVRPTVLIGTAAQPSAFPEALVREMASHTERPIIFPLSNPTSKCEAIPADLLAWTDGRALIGTGSPFADVVHAGRTYRIGQCNNAFIFPGVGLGVIASGARRVSDTMFVAAAQALAECSPARQDPTAALYPVLEDVREVSFKVAMAVGMAAQRDGLAGRITPDELERRVRLAMWKPRYARLRRAG